MRSSTYKILNPDFNKVNTKGRKVYNVLLKCAYPKPVGKKTWSKCGPGWIQFYQLKFGDSVKNEFMCFPCRKCYACRWNDMIYGIGRGLADFNAYDCVGMWLTATYDQDMMPKIPCSCEHDVGVLDRDGFIKAMKRYRDRLKYHHDTEVKILAVGEYGTNPLQFKKQNGRIVQCGQRPHYHILVMGSDEKELFDRSWIDVKTKRPLGEVFPGHINHKTLRYTLSHDLKKGVNQFVDSEFKHFYFGKRGLGKAGVKKWCEIVKKRYPFLEFDVVPDFIIGDCVWPMDPVMVGWMCESLDIQENDERIWKNKVFHESHATLCQENTECQSILQMHMEHRSIQREQHIAKEKIFAKDTEFNIK